MGKDQVLRIEPAEVLKFKGPYTDVVTSELHISNPTSQKVAFKVKTTAPKRYCVKPNCAILEPAARVTVQVMLQPADFDPNEKPKHKFMIQSILVPDGPGFDLEALWKSATPDMLMDTKLRCAFENIVPAQPSQPTQGQSSQPQMQQPQQQSHAGVAVSPCDSAYCPADKTSYITTPDAANRQLSKGSVSEMEEQYIKVMNENNSLKSELSELQKEVANRREENLRLRKVAVSDVAAAPPLPPPPAPVVKKPPVLLLAFAFVLLSLVGFGVGLTTVKYGLL